MVPDLRKNLPTILLLTGIVAPLLYLTTDLVASSMLPGYSMVTQSTSVLSAPGARTRVLVATLFLVVYSLVVVFGVTVWLSAGGSWSLRLIAWLLIGSAILQALGIVVFPYHPAEAASAVPNVLNLAMLVPSIVIWYLVIVLGVVAFDNWFRFFSIGLLLPWLGYVVLATVGASFFVPGGHPGALVGLQERSMAYTFYLWMALFAVVQFGIAEVAIPGVLAGGVPGLARIFRKVPPHSP